MRYETTLQMEGDVAQPMELDLGRVCEVARVRLNGRDLGCRLFAPYRFALPPGLLRRGVNELSVEVTSLGANRVRWIYRTNHPWKKFGDTNFVNYDYKRFDASNWKVVPCGLLGPVSLVSSVQPHTHANTVAVISISPQQSARKEKER